MARLRPRSWSSGPLSPEGLSHLASHKYNGVDNSYLSRYVLYYYWEWAVKLLPMWLAPNLVTLIGFTPILFFVALLSKLAPDLEGPVPGWFYFGSACAVWFYSTMDNVDGKQARRTETSSPLGELFDHGIDSLNCTLASLLHATALGLGSTHLGAFAAILPCLPMYFSTWETYHTKTLYLGYINGPTEGLVIAVAMMLATSVYGPGMWATPINDIFPSLKGVVDDSRNIRDCWALIMGGAFVLFHLPECVFNVRAQLRKENKPFLPVLYEWIPITVFSVACAAWLGSPHSFILRNNHLILFCSVLSLVFGRMTTKIILHYLTHHPFPMWTFTLLPLCLGALFVNRPFFGFEAVGPEFELWYVRIYGIYAAVLYFRWAYFVIEAFCSHLKISCFTIPYRSRPE